LGNGILPPEDVYSLALVRRGFLCKRKTKAKQPIPVADEPLKTPTFSRVRVTESIVAALLVTLISGTSGGVLWLVVQLPNRLEQMELSIQRILDNQKQFETRFGSLEDTVSGHEKRIIKLELTR
jgi:hypothetical protein